MQLSLAPQAVGSAACRPSPRLPAAKRSPGRKCRFIRAAAGGGGSEQLSSDEDPSPSQLVERLMADPQNAATIQRVTNAAEKVAALQAESERLAMAMAAAAADEAAGADERERRGQQAAAALMAEAEAAAAEKLLQAAQLQAEAADVARQKWAADINEASGYRGGRQWTGWAALAAAGPAAAMQALLQVLSRPGIAPSAPRHHRSAHLQDAEKLESAKAAAVAGVGGAAAALPLAASDGSGLLAALLAVGAAGLASALLGVTYRYAVRQDVGNLQLKVCAALVDRGCLLHVVAWGPAVGVARRLCWLRAAAEPRAHGCCWLAITPITPAAPAPLVTGACAQLGVAGAFGLARGLGQANGILAAGGGGSGASSVAGLDLSVEALGAAGLAAGQAMLAAAFAATALELAMRQGFVKPFGAAAASSGGGDEGARP